MLGSEFRILTYIMIVYLKNNLLFKFEYHYLIAINNDDSKIGLVYACRFSDILIL